MPDLMDRLYCSEQIHIPPTFPFIMKLYCKAAIRTQPYDLLKWSAAYFRALANGEEPPVKDRIEYPPYDSPSGLTPGYIKMLIKQLGKNPQTMVSAQTLFVKWNCICLEDELLVKLVALMGAKTSFNWLKFVAVACGYISTSLTNTMILICEVLTEEPEGGMATIPLDTFNELYTHLAYMECGPLTDEERMQSDEKEFEEDVSVVAEKIRSAVYEGEGVEGEFAPEEVGDQGEVEQEVTGERDKDKEDEEEEKERIPTVRLDTMTETKEVKDEEEDGEASVDDDEHSKGGASSKESVRYDGGVSPEPVDDSASKGQESMPESTASAENEEVLKEQPLLEATTEPTSPHPEKSAEEKLEEKHEGERERKLTRRIKLEDIEESIRHKIQERLDSDRDSIRSDEGFDELGSYLLDAAARVRMYTAEEIGYRIFKKYVRQEVPGIGPKIDQVEVEKVIDFMDYNSHKQQGMVMPRNIRHWMCPPLDKVPLPQP